MKTIEAKDVLFFYSPNAEELTLYSGAKFIYNVRTKRFQLDLNPHGESRLIDIENTKVNESFNQIEFNINNKGKTDSYIVKSDFVTCKYVFEIVSSLNQPLKTADDLDKVDVYFEQDYLSHLYIHKLKEYKIIDSLRVIREDNLFYLIKNKPEYSKSKIDDIFVREGKIVLKSQGTDVSFPLNLNPLVYNIFENLVKLNK